MNTSLSFIATVYNEEKTVEPFIRSIFEQTKKPDEIIIVDGGSADGTVAKIKDVQLKNKEYKGRFIILTKKGNRSVGRNEAIKHTRGDIIVCSDSGNILDKDWLKHITAPFIDSSIAVVAGYYKGLAKSIFQKCLIPYVLVMPDKVNPDTFLPATRSVAFRKSIWKKVGGFNEKLSHNEDYAFAKALQKAKAKIVFKKNAIVYWMPRASLKEAFIMFFRFAYGDAEAKIYRPKVFLLFFRYVVAIAIIISIFIYHSYLLLFILFIKLLFYILWSIYKNYRYVKDPAAFIILPALQFAADIAVLSGTISGAIGRNTAH